MSGGCNRRREATPGEVAHRGLGARCGARSHLSPMVVVARIERLSRRVRCDDHQTTASLLHGFIARRREREMGIELDTDLGMESTL